MPACGLATFVAATALGIIPATFAFAFVGAGLDSVDRRAGGRLPGLPGGRARRTAGSISICKRAITPELLAALAALGVLALIPVVVKRLRARRVRQDPSERLTRSAARTSAWPSI